MDKEELKDYENRKAELGNLFLSVVSRPRVKRKEISTQQAVWRLFGIILIVIFIGLMFQ